MKRREVGGGGAALNGLSFIRSAQQNENEANSKAHKKFNGSCKNALSTTNKPTAESEAREHIYLSVYLM